MKRWARIGGGASWMVLAGVVLWAAESKDDIVKRLWPKERIEAALRNLETQKTGNLISPELCQRKKEMLQMRLAGTFQGEMLSTTNPPLNFIQNGGYEEFNPNSRRNMSRWMWWGGWAWPEDAEYVNDKEERPEFVHSGKLSARFTCVGKPARTGISTPKLPIVPGATGYELTVWAKGEGDNMLHVAFESGAAGQFMEKIGSQWQEITVVGKPEEGAQEFMIWIYARGGGTVWLDDARLVPLGVTLDD